MKAKILFAPGTLAMPVSLGTYGNRGQLVCYACLDPKTNAYVANNPYQGIASIERWPYHNIVIGDEQMVMLLAVEKDENNTKRNYLRLLVGERTGWTFLHRRKWQEMIQRYRDLYK